MHKENIASIAISRELVAILPARITRSALRKGVIMAIIEKHEVIERIPPIDVDSWQNCWATGRNLTVPVGTGYRPSPHPILALEPCQYVVTFTTEKSARTWAMRLLTQSAVDGEECTEYNCDKSSEALTTVLTVLAAVNGVSFSQMQDQLVSQADTRLGDISATHSICKYGA